jgi:hypothetical protein
MVDSLTTFNVYGFSCPLHFENFSKIIKNLVLIIFVLFFLFDLLLQKKMLSLKKSNSKNCTYDLFLPLNKKKMSLG